MKDLKELNQDVKEFRASMTKKPQPSDQLDESSEPKKIDKLGEFDDALILQFFEDYVTEKDKPKPKDLVKLPDKSWLKKEMENINIRMYDMTC